MPGDWSGSGRAERAGRRAESAREREGMQQLLGPGREPESGEQRIAGTARPALLGESVCDRERRVC